MAIPATLAELHCLKPKRIANIRFRPLTNNNSFLHSLSGASVCDPLKALRRYQWRRKIRLSRKEYISDKSLLAVRNVIEYLKEDVIQRDIFRGTGHEAFAQQIARELHKGGPTLYRILEEASVKDIASGLMVFLMCLKKPLLPPHIQAIVLEIVAQDVLGLVNQEVHGGQFRLLQYVLDLLNHVLKYTPTDELSGSNVPIYMMPVFFNFQFSNFQAEHVMHWRRVAIIFLEVIRLAPHNLNIMPEPIDGNMLIAQNIRHGNEPEWIPVGYLEQRLMSVHTVIRRYLTRAGNRGDSTCLEVYERQPRTWIQRHRP